MLLWLRYFAPLNEAGRWDKGLLETHTHTYLRRSVVVMLLASALHGFFDGSLISLGQPHSVLGIAQAVTLGSISFGLFVLFYFAAFVWVAALFRHIEQSKRQK